MSMSSSAKQTKTAPRKSLRDSAAWRRRWKRTGPVSSRAVLAVAAYFPLASVPSAARLLTRHWPEPVEAVLNQQLREPAEEERLRASIPQLTPIEDQVSRSVRAHYEENPYPR